MIDELQELVDELDENPSSPPTATVRELLSWFDAQRRGSRVTNEVRKALRDAGLQTTPDFEVPHLGTEVEFRRREDSETNKSDYSDPVPRIGQLDAASRFPKTIDRDAEVSEAVTIMMMNDYSQLPVIQGRRKPDGYISWQTIGFQTHADSKPEYVRDCMDDVTVLKESKPLFEGLPVIAEEQFVLVRGSVEKTITGLVTVSDITMEFNRLAEHFLHIGVIENHLRRLIQDNFQIDEIRDSKNPSDEERKINSVADLTFGEYIRVVENQENWKRLDLDLSRTHFCERFRKVRDIRNDVMHFHPDEFPDEDRQLLKQTVRFMRHI